MTRAIQIPDFAGYYITDNGNVYTRLSYRNNPDSRIKKLSAGLVGHGYLKVILRKNNKNYNKLVHRLVAETFIPNPENKPQVNHIDGNKLNNCVENLEWNTSKENVKHRCEILKIRGFEKVTQTIKPKKVLQIKDNKIIKEFNSVKDAIESITHGKKHIYDCCRGTRKYAGGYQWQYKN